MPIRVAVGEDSLIVREGVQQLLAVDPDVEVVAAVADLDALREVCERHQPDVLLTDIRMPPTNTDEGIRFAAELRDANPQMGVVVLISIEERSDVPSAAQLGAVPFVRKQDFGPRLLRRLWSEHRR